MQPQRCPRCRSTWTERKLSPRSRQSSRGSRKVVGDCAGGFHMAAGAVLGAASIYLRFIIQPTTAPDATPTWFSGDSSCPGPGPSLVDNKEHRARVKAATSNPYSDLL